MMSPRFWEFAQLTFVEGWGQVDSVFFSHPQHPSTLQYAMQWLGPGLKPESSSPMFLHLNRNHIAIPEVMGMLGDMGWELVGMSTHPGGHAYYTFKRERPAPRTPS